jgi:hypothetical protein
MWWREWTIVLVTIWMVATDMDTDSGPVAFRINFHLETEVKLELMFALALALAAKFINSPY